MGNAPRDVPVDVVDRRAARSPSYAIVHADHFVVGT